MHPYLQNGALNTTHVQTINIHEAH